MSTLSGSAITSAISSSLSSTYSILSGASGGSVTAANIMATMTTSTYASTLNSTFANYILSNFSTYDQNGDGVISSTEMNSANTLMQATGFTQSQLSQLGTASGLSSQALSDVLSHFKEIDENGDGKVTNAEITAYTYKSAEGKEKTMFANRAAANQSVFYGDDSSSSSNDSSSMLSFKYMDTDGSSSSS